MGNAPWAGGLNVNCGGLFCPIEGGILGGVFGHGNGKDGSWAGHGYGKDVRLDDVPWANGSEMGCRGFFRRRAERERPSGASGDRYSEAWEGWLTVLNIRICIR